MLPKGCLAALDSSRAEGLVPEGGELKGRCPALTLH